jgi:hypothetical protein
MHACGEKRLLKVSGNTRRKESFERPKRIWQDVIKIGVMKYDLNGLIKLNCVRVTSSSIPINLYVPRKENIS